MNISNKPKKSRLQKTINIVFTGKINITYNNCIKVYTCKNE